MGKKLDQLDKIIQDIEEDLKKSQQEQVEKTNDYSEREAAAHKESKPSYSKPGAEPSSGRTSKDIVVENGLFGAKINGKEFNDHER